MISVCSGKKPLYYVFTVLIIGLLMSGLSVTVLAEGEQIIAQLDQMMRADVKVMEQQMILYNASGQQRTRELSMSSSRQDGVDSMLVRFTAPADVRGTGLLMVNDDMWLYMPALGRVRRIAGHAKQGNFMGSDFSYADMEQIAGKGFSNDFTVTKEDEQVLTEHVAYVLYLDPKVESDYSFLRMWVDSKRYLPLRIEYYDQNDQLLKVLTTSDYQLVDERWTAKTLQMENIQSSSKTVMHVKQVQFDIVLDPNVFTTRNLERGL